MRIIESIDKLIAKIETALVILLLSAMIILAFTQVVLRNVFSKGILWADPMLRYIVLWIAFLGASLATREDRHINIDILTRLLSPRLKKITGTVVNLFTAGVCFLLLRASVVFIKTEIEFPREIFFGLKVWMVESIIPVGFLIMGLRFILNAVKICISRTDIYRQRHT